MQASETALSAAGDLAAAIARALEERDFAQVRALAAHRLPADLADAIQELPAEQRAVAFRLLPRELAADTFEYLTSEVQEELLRSLGREEVAAILNEMSPDDRTALLEELPASVTRQLLQLLSSPERRIAQQLLGYPEDSIGRLMTPDYLAVRPEWTVQQALEYIREHGHDRETLNVIYVVDEKGKLLDDLRIRQLLLARPEATIWDLCDGSFVALRAMDDQEQAVKIFAEYDRVAFPVVDSQGMLLGIVTVDDVLDVVEEETTEDIQKIGGMAALEEPYLRASLREMVRKRAGWLVVLFFGQMLTANVMGYFQNEIASAMVLVLFLPLIISSGGNSGSQAATLVIRAMALGEVTLAHWWAVMRREILSGLALGGIVGSIGFARIAVGEWTTGAYGPAWLWIGFTVGCALVGVVLWGTLVGSMLPFILRSIGLDPATSSTPFVATFVDVTGLLIYFSIAAVVLRGILV